MIHQIDIDAGAKEIVAEFTSGQPFFIGRNGSTEMELLTYWLYKTANGLPWPPELMAKIQRYSGVWPPTQDAIEEWATTYLASLRELDGLAAGWYAPYAPTETRILDEYAPQAFRTPLRSLEPYYVEPKLRWSQHLANKRVAVISSFADSIYTQYTAETPMSKTVWSSVKEPETLMPGSIVLMPIRTYFPDTISAGDRTSWPRGVESWKDAVDFIVKQTKALKPDVALIGCGGLGMIIAAELKRAGISAIVLGGAIQVLFGIKGSRWANHDIISKFWNQHWIWPSISETPSAAGSIEGGCYWGSNTKSSIKIL